MEQFILKAALEGYEAQKAQIEQRIGYVTGMMQGFISLPATSSTAKTITSAVVKVPKRTMSAAGRAAIKAALKKRWAAYHKAQKRGKK